MNDFVKKNWRSALYFVIIIVSIFTFLMIIIPKAKAILVIPTTSLSKEDSKEVIHYVAIGDSLTEGIGDSTDSGGFVPLVARDLEETFRLNGVQVDNFGKNGDRSDQVLKRIKKDKVIQKELASADIITLTIGGNDLMKVVRGDIFSLTKNSFNKPLKNYQKELKNLLNELREYNDQAPIYVLGIYNPFYLYFPEMTEMQDIIDNWNDGTEEVTKEETHVYFIPINDLLYKGVNNKVGVTNDQDEDVTYSSSEKQDIVNNALYEEDKFHPNNLGYQLMASEVLDKIVQTQKLWLPKESE